MIEAPELVLLNSASVLRRRGVVAVLGAFGAFSLFAPDAVTPAASLERESGPVSSAAGRVADATAPGSGAAKLRAGTVAGGCAVSTPNVPDGPDPAGGCFPGPSNTGVPVGTALSDYTGPCTITVADTVIDSKTVTCKILVRANGLIIKNSVLKGGVSGLVGQGASFTIQDSFLDNGVCVNCSVDGWNFTVLRTEITGSNRGVYCMNTCRVQDSWIHGTALDPTSEWHASAVRVEQNATLVHNVLACDWTGPFNNDQLGCSANLTGYPDFAPIRNNTMDGNLFVANPVGVGYCAYGGGTRAKPYSADPTNATYVVFKNNVFQRGPKGRCGTWGPITDFVRGRTGNVWVGNVWDSGTIVPPR
jgi:hypothetical protein